MNESQFKLPKQEVIRFCKKYHIASLALFGSALTTHFGPRSDVDLLVEFDPKYIPTLFDMVDMESELTLIVGRTVDLRTAQDLSPYFRQDVIAKATTIYARS